jgi:hypothetical protein
MTFLGQNLAENRKIPDTVTSLESGALGVFDKCSALESISLPSNLTLIGSNCFKECENLTSIVIPEKVNIIYGSSFYKCTNLKKLTIGKSVTNIYSKAFAECKNLESVVSLAENPPTANSDAFENSYIEYATLYVLENSISNYNSKEPWSKFGQIMVMKVGDASGDGKVDMNDALFILNFLLGNLSANFNAAAADTNGDGVVDIADAVHIVNYITGKITSLAPQTETSPQAHQ